MREPISAATTLGPVHLTVADLERSIGWYERALGLGVHAREGAVARLGTGGPAGDLLVLVEEPGARPVQGHTGLFHYALLVPDRESLARWLVHAGETRLPLTGMSDHGVSEAIYLRDPDGHGIEIYRDRPRAEWPRPARGTGVDMYTIHLDVDDLLDSVRDRPNGFDGLPAGTRMGHVHLHVADVDDATRFYDELLGMDVTAHLGDQAVFLSAGGYHHHIGANTWAGRGATPPPPGSAALRHFEVVLPDEAERDRVARQAAAGGAAVQEVDRGALVRDPSQNAMLLRAAA